MGLKIATFNVNSIRARIDTVRDWLEKAEPDLLLLQEIKCTREDFPYLELEALGYRVEVVGQKAYNGVAAVSRFEMKVVSRDVGGDPGDAAEARYLEVECFGITCIAVYAPNGNPVGGDKFLKKLRWLENLERRIAELLEKQESFLVAGDFNVIPTPLDCHSVEAVKNNALYSPEARAVYWRLIGNGMTDAYRMLHPDEPGYTYWDYAANRFAADCGLRIDHFMLSPTVADDLKDCFVDTGPRGSKKPSDHTPLVIELARAG